MKKILGHEKAAKMKLSNEIFLCKVGRQRKVLAILNDKLQAVNETEQETDIFKAFMLKLEQQLESATEFQETVDKENTELKIVCWTHKMKSSQDLNYFNM